MQPLKGLLDTLPAAVPAANADRVAARAASVRAMFKDAIGHCYGEAAPAVLAHVNAVYLLKDDQEATPHKVLKVYMDDANFRSDVCARQYFIVLWLKERYGETVDEFCTYSARAAMRRRKAYSDEASAHPEADEDEPRLRPITESDERALWHWGCAIEDLTLRNAFLKAARSGLGRWS